MLEVIYCPVCRANIRKRKKCPGCGYESARDYELYPTLSPVPKDIEPVSVKRNRRETQRIQEIIEKQMQPKLDELKQETKTLEKKLLKIEKEGISSSDSVVENDLPKNGAAASSADSRQSASSRKKNVAKRKPRQSVITINDNTCTFGSYPQDADGTEHPILWKVLEVDQNEGKALLLSDKILDCRPYYTEYTKDTNWEKAGTDSKGLRYWLNHDFYEKAFSDEDKNLILPTNVMPHANPNPKYNKNQGNAVQDKIFLLSAEEVIHYFARSKPNIRRRDNYVSLGGTQAVAEGTEYVKKSTALYVYKDDGNSSWWLRSVGRAGSDATCVSSVGVVRLYGTNVRDEDVGVRPALWVNLKS